MGGSFPCQWVNSRRTKQVLTLDMLFIPKLQ
jgi:hypothetical protein